MYERGQEIGFARIVERSFSQRYRSATSVWNRIIARIARRVTVPIGTTRVARGGCRGNGIDPQAPVRRRRTAGNVQVADRPLGQKIRTKASRAMRLGNRQRNLEVVRLGTRTSDSTRGRRQARIGVRAASGIRTRITQAIGVATIRKLRDRSGIQRVRRQRALEVGMIHDGISALRSP